MRGPGRLAALPILLIALAVQALSPAAAATMRADASPFGAICSAHGLGGAAHRPDPAKGQGHDCCAFACALAGLTAIPPAHTVAVRIAFAAPAELRTGHGLPAPTVPALDRPKARAPPASLLTT